MDFRNYLIYSLPPSLPPPSVYRPGERGEYWYAVVSGSLEMLDVDPDDSTKTNSICYLRDGDSFGENVIYGTCRYAYIIYANSGARIYTMDVDTCMSHVGKV